jgi:hypothetical protein
MARTQQCRAETTADGAHMHGAVISTAGRKNGETLARGGVRLAIGCRGFSPMNGARSLTAVSEARPARSAIARRRAMASGIVRRSAS